MKAGVPLLVLALAGCAPPMSVAGGGATQRIVSTNPCADAMLVELVPPTRIAAISHYSQDPGATSMSVAVARRFHATAGTAEEVIALRPALVLTSSFTPLATRVAYERAGLKTLLLDSPTSVAASEAQVMAVARAVGEPERGRAMVGRIERALAALATPVPDTIPASIFSSPAEAGAQSRAAGWGGRRPVTSAIATGLRPSPEKEAGEEEKAERPTALLFLNGNLANGPGTLLDELMTRAGLHNAAGDYGLTWSAPVSIETIVARPPRLILIPGPSRAASLHARVLARSGAATREAMFPRRLVNCGGPTIIPAMARLIAIRRGLAQ